MRRALASLFVFAGLSIGLAPSAFAMPVCGGPCQLKPATTHVLKPKVKPRPKAAVQWVTTRPGDTLTGLAARVHRSWQALGAFNRVADPSVIMVGERLRIPAVSWQPPSGYGVVTPVQLPTESPVPSVPAEPPSVVQSSTSGGSAGGSFGDCVRARESGGNYQVMNSSGHYGAYQFAYGTWVAYGGSPGAFGNASPSQQDQVFANAVAQGGQSNWTRYDGC